MSASRMMGRTESKALRWAAVLVGVLLAAGVVVSYAAQGLTPSVSESEARVITAVLVLGWLGSTAVAARRVREDLDGVAHARRAAAGVAPAFVRAGATTRWAMSKTSGAGVSLLAVFSPVISAALALAAPVYAPSAGLGVAVLAAVVPALVSGWVLARRVSAYQRVALTARVMTTAAVVAGVASAVVAGLAVPRDNTLLAIAMAGITGVAVAGVWSGRDEAVQARRRRRLGGPLAAALGCAQSTLEDASKARWRVRRDNTVVLYPPLPADVVRHLDGLPERLDLALPSHEVTLAGAHDGIVLAPISDATVERRALLAGSDGLVFSAVPIDGGGEIWSLTAKIKPADAGRLSALARAAGMALVDLDLSERRAEVRPLDDRVTVLRERVAELTGREPWQVELTASWHAEGWLCELTVGRGSTVAADRRTRLERWREIFEQLSPHRPGTVVTIADGDGAIRLTRGPDPLSEMVTIEDFIEENRGDSDWRSFPVAVTEDGALLDYSLFHTLIVGQTGAGKGSALWAILSGLMPAWHEGLARVVGVDPKASELLHKDGGTVQPHGLLDEVATEPESWLAVIEAVHSEMKARQQTGARSFMPTTETPLLVLVIDELSAIGLMDRDSKRAAEVEQLLLEIMSQGRSAGVFVLAAVQAPQKESVGRTRPFFGMRIALRTETRMETNLVLGDGATDAGAAAHLIPVASPGNGYRTAGQGFVAAEGEAGYQRVRFPYSGDADLDRWHEECLASRPRSERSLLTGPSIPTGWLPKSPESVPELDLSMEDFS